jgi:hypothetical protein
MLEDLEFKDGDLELPIEELASRHPMVEAFRHQRSQLPVGQEAIQGLTSNIIAFSLHAGEDRGLTWHHEQAGIVWLLASRFHRSGNPEDAYPYFRDLDKRGVLLPTRADLAAWARSQVPTLARSLLSDVPRLRKEAVANPGAVVRGTIGGRIAVRVVQDVDRRPCSRWPSHNGFFRVKCRCPRIGCSWSQQRFFPTLDRTGSPSHSISAGMHLGRTRSPSATSAKRIGDLWPAPRRPERHYSSDHDVASFAGALNCEGRVALGGSRISPHRY